MRRAGLLDTLIAIQRKSQSYSSTGEPTETWSTLAQRWADLRPVTGTELNAAEQWVAREQTEFTIRWSPDVADVSPLDRIICPASAASSSPVLVRSIYDVIAVHEPIRNDTLKLLAARRVG
jgi:head-tail adaptor